MTFAEYIASRPDLANNWANAFSPEYEFDETAQAIRGFSSFEDYIANDFGRPFDAAPQPPVASPTARGFADQPQAVVTPEIVAAPDSFDIDPPMPEAPPEPNELPPPAVLSAPGAVVAPVLYNSPLPGLSAPGPISAILDLSPASPAPASSPSTATTMTAAQYLASRPDLAANWDRAFQAGFADDPTAEWIRSFGSLEEYLRNDYGRAFDTPTAGANPPPNANAGGTNATASTTTGTANTGGSNTTLVSANDASILGGIDQFLRTASGILGAITGNNSQNPPNTPTTPPAAQNQTKTILMVLGVGVAAFVVARSMS